MAKIAAFNEYKGMVPVWETAIALEGSGYHRTGSLRREKPTIEKLGYVIVPLGDFVRMTRKAKGE